MKTHSLYFLVLSFFLLFLGQQFGQTTIKKDSNLIQFSGIVLTADSLKVLPYTTIINKNRHTGMISDHQGFFSLVVRSGDTISFEFMGYHNKEYIVPDTLKSERYSIIQLMVEDFIYLNETVIFPWNTKAQFKEAFVHTAIPADDLERAKNNLELDRIKQLGKKIQTDPSLMADKYLKDYSDQFYYYGQAPPNNFLNPFAWARFFDAWQNGEFKR